MTGFFESTGMETVDVIRGLQMTADQIDDPDAKIKHVRNVLQIVGAAELLGRPFMVDATEVWGKRPDTQRELIRFTDGLLFVGQLKAFGYMVDPDIPIDSLSLNFSAPEVLGVDLEDEFAFKSLSLQVPVLAVARCTAAS
jgi:hypothetical protein